MTRSSGRFAPRSLAAALVLLASVGSARPVSAPGPPSGGSAASGKIGALAISTLAIDPKNPTTIYAGTGCSGVLKSFDGADNWETVNTGLPPSTHGWVGINALVIDPITSTTLYSGTYGKGAFRSQDGGATWQKTGLTAQYVWGLAIDPTSPLTVYAATSDGVFRTGDGGSTWIRTNAGITRTATDLAVDPATPTTVYAGTDSEAGVFRSLNSGASWQITGLAVRETINVLAVTPSAPTIVYAGTTGGVFRSLDAGKTWSAVSDGLPVGAIILALVIDPTNPATLYAGMEYGRGVSVSLDGGGRWRSINDDLTSTNYSDAVTALAVDPVTPTTLYAATNNDGLFRSTNGGSSWQPTGLSTEFCGDGLVGCNEACDDHGESATCNANCTPARCGDGTLNIKAGEQCDDGNNNPFDGCSNGCVACGDGIVTSPEECDDGNTPSDDCDAQCRLVPEAVGTGTPESCTEAAFDAALARHSVRFDCGQEPVTITLAAEKQITTATTIDGRGNQITLSGGGRTRLFKTTAALDLRNLTIADGGSDSGGAIHSSGPLSVTNCTFTNNSAETAGGVIYNSAPMSATNCTFFDNSATPSNGGAIYAADYAELTNCTLSDNGGPFATQVYCSPVAPCGGNGFIVFRNTIIAESAGPICEGVFLRIQDGGHNLQFPDASCGVSIPVLDPMLDPAGLQDNGGATETIALRPGSPAIAAGDSEVCAKPPVNGVDQRGYARPGLSVNCSIGAYEAEYPLPTPRRSESEDGCTMTPTRGAEGVWWLVVPAMALWWVRRRGAVTNGPEGGKG